MKECLVVLPVPGRGHLVSTVEFAKLINKHNHFSITVLTMAPPFPDLPTVPDSYFQSVASSGLDINFLELKPVDPPDDPSLDDFILSYIDSHTSDVKTSILGLQSSIRVVALVVDFFATTVQEVGNQLGIPTYLFFTSGASLLSLMLYLPTLDIKVESEFEDLEEDVEIPGLGPLPPLVMPAPLLKKKSKRYLWFVESSRRFRYMKGLIVNTFRELEPAALEAIAEGRSLPDYPTPPVFPVGPVLVLEEKDPSHPCITWLDNQPPRSVVFLCFGSMGALPEPQVKELALGLENSGHRFLWSIRTRRNQNVFSPPTNADLDEVLPQGFLDRTKERGLVWPRWAPQTDILSHEAIGGFVSHCGWNSTLESMWFGVPILPWPLRAEQRLNGFKLVSEIGAAVELEMNYRGQSLVGASEVERGVRSLMGNTEEGKKARDKAMEMRAASRAAVDAGGSSFDALTRLTEQLLSHGL
ncbi:malvidin galactosylase UGT88C3-like [Aristolochia californica]|uniref:malvidin galactosylase UGT88C3-like n=1 Tax=Aristolochia californica TaxID=171875 RepID=UPI0035D97E86